ncbi:M1 family metallopeptidase [Taibaiella koreensis]|uniref:M1 family metallopeptidase n=1 Tax=Taibaiella koreensis TaxID=1268548 RepID=UPI000E59B2F0|nr:M1 family metallopeptidase [Taibaiella koreensis]
MNKHVFMLPLAALCLLASCQSGTGDSKAAQQAPAAATIEKDWHTLSNADSVKVTHLGLDIAVDFNQKKIKGSAHWDFQFLKSSSSIVFDTWDLTIDSVLLDDGSKASFVLEAKDTVLGSALRIPVKSTNKALTIYYSTGTHPTALQWLDPAQTFGKKQPFLYTQSESIYARSWIPCQDGPGIRYTYDARVKVPAGLMALMSAENPQQRSVDGNYHFKMEQPVPAYLMALAVGDIGFSAVDSRTGVYAETVLLPKGHKELEDIGTMVHTAEKLYGPYRWGRYDVLVLPSGFPIGGMENPRLTFCTPTILAGDKSLVNLIAHELAHSWSGNLVTNATWNDFWLNEGFTVYFERRITEATYGKDYVDMLWELGFQDMKAAVDELGAQSKDTWLKLDLKGRDPDIGLTDIAYEKGAAFLYLVEQTVGRDNMDRFLRGYFDSHAFKTIETEQFLAYLDEHLLNQHPDWKKKINIDAWVYGPGIPANCPHAGDLRFKKAEAQSAAFAAGTPAAKLDTAGWSTYEWMHFLRHLPNGMPVEKMKDLDQAFHLTQTGNSELADLWFLQAIRNHYEPAYPAMKQFLYVTGRQKFLEPLYKAMKATPEGLVMARDIYNKARPNYHPLAQKTIDEILQ